MLALVAHISLLIEYQQADMASRDTKGANEEKRQTLRRMKTLLIAFRGLMDERLKPMGVTTSQVQMLDALRTHPGASGAQLARACRVTPQTAQGFLARAEREGWIVRMSLPRVSGFAIRFITHRARTRRCFRG